MALKLPWQYCFIIGGSFLLFMALLNFLFLNPYPAELGFFFNQRSDSEDDIKSPVYPI
jgi:hypothetical protein